MMDASLSALLVYTPSSVEGLIHAAYSDSCGLLRMAFSKAAELHQEKVVCNVFFQQADLVAACSMVTSARSSPCMPIHSWLVIVLAQMNDQRHEQ